MSTLHERVRRLVDGAPETALVPVGTLAEWLEEDARQDEEARATLSLEDVAERASRELFGGRKAIQPATVRKWARQGLRGVKLEAFGRPLVVDPAAWDRFVAAQGRKEERTANASAPALPAADVADEIGAFQEHFGRQPRRGKGGE